MGQFFHASTERNLKVLQPRLSTHGSFVYATPYYAIACGYLGKWDDFDLWQGLQDGTPTLVERYRDAFEKVFSRRHGSIYAVDSRGFVDGQTPWHGVEFVNRNEVAVVSEENVDNAQAKLLGLLEKGLLRIYKFPARPDFLDSSDRDLVEKAKRWLQYGNRDEKIISLRSRVPHVLDALAE